MRETGLKVRGSGHRLVREINNRYEGQYVLRAKVDNRDVVWVHVKGGRSGDAWEGYWTTRGDAICDNSSVDWEVREVFEGDWGWFDV